MEVRMKIRLSSLLLALALVAFATINDADAQTPTPPGAATADAPAGARPAGGGGLPMPRPDCSPQGALNFVCGPLSVEDIVLTSGGRWILGSSFRPLIGIIYMIDAQSHTA